MKHSKSPMYTPYGAWELKATYQRNLLAANLVVAGLVFSILASFWLAGLFDEPIPPPIIGDPDESRRDSVVANVPLGQKVAIIQEGPVIGSSHPRSDPLRGYIPVAVPDDQIDEELNQTILTKAERHNATDFGNEGGEGLNFGQSGWGGTGGGDGYPAPDSFVIVEVPPELVFRSEPHFPLRERRLGLEGSVWVQALVDKDGSAVKAIIKKSSGIEALDESALKAALKNRFKPAIQSGRPVAVWVTYRVDFVLD